MNVFLQHLLDPDMPAWPVVAVPPALVAGIGVLLASFHWSAALAFVVLIEIVLQSITQN